MLDDKGEREREGVKVSTITWRKLPYISDDDPWEINIPFVSSN